MSRRHRVSLACLQKRLGSTEGRRDLHLLLATLVSDDRVGARSLADRCRRRLDLVDRLERRERELFALRQKLISRGCSRVAGVDEAGMGPLAGPVVAAAVIFPEQISLPGLDDSKRLSRRNRETLARSIREQALCYSIASVEPAEIDQLNIYNAGLEAMRRAVTQLTPSPDHVLVDARRIPDLTISQTPLVHGDGRDGSIAAASILAKVFRDGVMERLDRSYPGYGFASHKGYPTQRHLAALRRMGPSKVHRWSFSPVPVSVLS